MELRDAVRLEAAAMGEGDLFLLMGTILLPPPSDSKSDRVSLFRRNGSEGDSDEIEDCDSRWRAMDCDRTESAHLESADGETGERVGVPVKSEVEFRSNGRGPECVRGGILSGSLNDEDKDPRTL